MLDGEAVKIAREMLESEAAAKAARFGLEEARITANAIKTGGFGGSGYLASLADLCASDIEAGADRAWRLLHRTIIATGVQFSTDLRERLAEAFDALFVIVCAPS